MSSVLLENVSLSLPIFGADAYSLKKSLVRMTTGGRLQRGSAKSITVEALKNVSLDLQDGDRVGLIGHNGAGKTTLLRVISGIYAPTTGTIRTEGRIAPLIKPGIGISHEATGYENIRLCGLYMGLSRGEIDDLLPEIAEFSGLGDYLSMPTHTYSQGMLTRLSFSVVTAIHPDILLLDEALGAGDADFREQALKRFADLLQRAKILVLASHDPTWIMKSCTKALVMHCGEAVYFGPVDQALQEYERCRA